MGEFIEPTLYRIVCSLRSSTSTNSKTSSSTKIGMFDMDHTLIRPKNGRTFPKTPLDWEFVYPDIPERLEKLEKDGYRIVIVTNQAQVSSAKKPDAKKRVLAAMKTRLQSVMDALVAKNVHPEIYASTAKDIWRKPNTLMFEKYIFPEITRVAPSAFYVGDAAGRPKDHTDTDRSFAYNLYLLFKLYHSDPQSPKFYTETEFFNAAHNSKDAREQREQKSWRTIDPKKYLKTATGGPTLAAGQNLVIMVGAPASGKSTIASKLARSSHDDNGGNNGIQTVIINQDTLKTKARCLGAARAALNAGNSVIIDNTNPTVAVRKEFLDLAPSGCSTQIVWVNLDKDLVMHLNQVRQRLIGAKRIPMVAYNVFYKKFEAPTRREAAVHKIGFQPNFKNKAQFLRFIQRSEPATRR